MKRSFFQAAVPAQWLQQWHARTAPARLRWEAMAPRERLGVSLAAAVLGLLLLWQLVIASAWRTLHEAPGQIDRLDAQLQAMQSLASEAQQLRAIPAVSAAQAATALTATTAPLGAAGKLSVQGERATLTLTHASSEQLRTWLGEARSAARARPIEAQLQRGPNGDSGTLVLSLGSASP